MNDQKNLLIAIVASILIMVTFQYFWEKPRMEAEHARQQQAAETGKPGQAQPQAPQTPNSAPGQAAAPGAQPQPAGPAPQATPGAPAAKLPAAPRVGPGGAPTQAVPPGGPAAPTKPVVISGPRVSLESPSIKGSIALRGGSIDDVVLTHYRQTTDPDSPAIRLLAPSGSAGAYYATHGWLEGDKAVTDANTLWKADRKRLTPGTPVHLTWDNGQGLRFTRTIAVDANYMFTITQRVENRGSAPVTLAPYAVLNRTGTPKTQGLYILHEGPLGVFDGHLEELKYKDLVKTGQVKKASVGGWIGITDKYWLAALVPGPKARVNARFLHWLAGKTDKYQTDFVGAARTIAPGGSAETTSRFFAGAKEVKLLAGYRDKLDITLFDRAIDFGYLWFLTKPFFYALDFLFKLFGNFGLAILAVTVLVKLLFFPLANKSYRSMSEMKKLQPKIQELKERFGDDKQKINQEMMELYKREKVNPASSCLPILIQIPVFFSLYKVLRISIEMRHAPFYGWITDLSVRDPTSVINLFGLLPYDVPAYVPHFLSIGVWPLIMGTTMFLQMRLNPSPPDPVQAKIFMFMPIFFTFIMAPFPAGLVIYWAWNNLLSMTQQWVIMKRMGVAPGKSAPGKT